MEYLLTRKLQYLSISYNGKLVYTYRHTHTSVPLQKNMWSYTAYDD